MNELTDRIQETLAAGISLVLVENDVRRDQPAPDTGSPEFEREIDRLRRLDLTHEERAKMREAVGGNSGAIALYLGEVSTGRIWLMGAHPDMPDLWHVIDWRCPRCKIDAARRSDEVHFTCAVCGLDLAHWEQTDEAGGANS
jgi:hypothetical protein